MSAGIGPIRPVANDWIARGALGGGRSVRVEEERPGEDHVHPQRHDDRRDAEERDPDAVDHADKRAHREDERDRPDQRPVLAVREQRHENRSTVQRPRDREVDAAAEDHERLAERDDADERGLNQEDPHMVRAREPRRECAGDHEEQRAHRGRRGRCCGFPAERRSVSDRVITIPLRRTYSSISEFASTARIRSSPVRTGVQNDEMPSVKITLAISVRMNAPAIVAAEAASAAEQARAADDHGCNGIQDVVVADGRRARGGLRDENSPPKAANNPESAYAVVGRPPGGDAGQVRGVLARSGRTYGDAGSGPLEPRPEQDEREDHPDRRRQGKQRAVRDVDQLLRGSSRPRSGGSTARRRSRPTTSRG